MAAPIIVAIALTAIGFGSVECKLKRSEVKP
jgi:hypothetical protein